MDTLRISLLVFLISTASAASTGSIDAPGAKGVTGMAGPTGTRGATGPIGITGITGSTGNVGPIGNQGAQGPIGPQGFQGATGSQGSTGAGASNPVQSLFGRSGNVSAVTGDYLASQILDAAELSSIIPQVFKAEIEAPDLRSLGIAGTNNASRYVGASPGAAPSTGTFQAGDFAVDDINGNIYVCTMAGSPGTWKTLSSSTQVYSLFGRTGAVVAASGDYSANKISGAADKSSSSAQTFTGAIHAPTLSADTTGSTARLIGASTGMPSGLGTYNVGDFVIDQSDGNIYLCTIAGSPGTWVVVQSSSQVSSLFTRTGVVTAQSGDYTANQISGAADKSSGTTQAFSGSIGTPTFEATASGITGITASSRLVGSNAGAHPSTGTFQVGDYVIDPTNGNIYICSIAGSPGTWKTLSSSMQAFSVFGRTGAVVSTSGDYSVSQISNAADKSSSSTQTFSGPVSSPSTLSASGLTGASSTARVVGSINTGAPPSSGTFNVGDFVSDISNGNLYICITSGTPGVWKTILGPTTGANVYTAYGRSGAVVATTGDYSASSITNAADKGSGSTQAFTASITAPTFSGTGITGAASTARITGAGNNMPMTGTFAVGDVVIDPTNGDIYICTSAGSPGIFKTITSNALVNTAFGRTGAVAATSGDYSANMVMDAADKSAGSTQAFTGSITTPTISATGIMGVSSSGRLVGASTSAPATGTFTVGDFVVDKSSGNFYICISSGSPGTWDTIRASSNVASVYGRTGTVTAQTGDYSVSMVTNAADKSSSSTQAFTGSITTPTIAATASGIAGISSPARIVGSNSAPPSSGTFAQGDVVVDRVNGNLYICTIPGSPGTWITITSNYVASVFGRTGAVVATAGDYTATEVSNAANKAAGSTQTFTGSITAPYFYSDATMGWAYCEGSYGQIPTSGGMASYFHSVGQFVVDPINGNIYVCITAGTPGTWKTVSSSNQVNSVFGRTGAVVAASADYSANKITNAADKSSGSTQAFTGAVTAPTVQANGITGASSATRLVGGNAGLAPGSGTFAVGDIVVDTTSGQLYVCTIAGSPGTWKTLLTKITDVPVPQSSGVSFAPQLLLFTTGTPFMANIMSAQGGSSIFMSLSWSNGHAAVYNAETFAQINFYSSNSGQNSKHNSVSDPTDTTVVYVMSWGGGVSKYTSSNVWSGGSGFFAATSYIAVWSSWTPTYTFVSDPGNNRACRCPGLPPITVAPTECITGLNNPAQILVSVDGNTVYLSEYGAHQIDVINVATWMITNTIALPGPVGEAMVLSPDGTTLYAGYTTNIAVISTTTQTITGTVTGLYSTICDMAIDVSGAYIYTTYCGIKVEKVSTSSLTVVAGNSGYPCGNNLNGDQIAVSAGDNLLYVGGHDGGSNYAVLYASNLACLSDPIGNVDPPFSQSISMTRYTTFPTTYTLTRSTSVRVTATVTLITSSTTVRISLNLAYGTGTGPLRGAPTTGTMFGNVMADGAPLQHLSFFGTTANNARTVTVVGRVHGLTIGQSYWFDVVITPSIAAPITIGADATWLVEEC